MKYRVKGTPFARDMSNMALLCTDHSQKLKYEEKLAMMKGNKDRDEEINNMKNELKEIKQMLQSLLNRG